MGTITVVSLLLVLFIIFSFLEPFNKRIRRWMRVFRFYLKNIRINRRNLKKFPRTARKIWPILRKKRGFIFFKTKVLANYHRHHQKTR